MDIILEIAVERLLGLIQQKFAQQGVAPAVLAGDTDIAAGGDPFVLTGVAVTGLDLAAAEFVSRPWNRPLLGPALDPFTFIPMQRVRGRIQVELSLATLSELREHRPSSPTLPRASRFTIQVVFEPVVRVTSGSATLGIEVQDLQGRLPIPLSPSEESALRSQALDSLRAATRGLDVALPLSVLGELVSGATEILNVGVAVETVLTDRGVPDPSARASFLQVGVQLARRDWIVLSDLERASLIARKSDELRAFHRSPAALRGAADFALFVSAEEIVASATAIVGTAVGSASERLSLRGPIAGSWINPITAISTGNVVLTFPVTALNACGTGHHLDAGVTARIRFGVLPPDRIELSVVLDYAVDGLALAGCALEVGGIGAFAGLVIGGVFGGWIGAIVGAIVGFLMGFVGVLLAAAFYRAELGRLPSICEENARHDVHCTFALPPAGGDAVLSALQLLRHQALGNGLAIQGALEFPAPGPAPRLEAAVFAPLHWSRRGAGRWVLAGRIYMTNVGGGSVMIGSATPIGAGSEVYAGRVRYAGGGIFTRTAAYIDIEIPLAEVEAARSASALGVLEVLIFSTGGARVVRFPGVPEPLSDEAMQLAEMIEAARLEVDRLGRDFAVLARPFPPVPDPRLFTIFNPAALLQAVIRFGKAGERWALVTSGGEVLDDAIVDRNGNAWLRAITAMPPERAQLVSLGGVADDKVTETAKQAVADAQAFSAEVAQALRASFENALTPEPKDPLAGGETKMDPVIAAGLERPVFVSKVDVQQFRDVANRLATKYGVSDRKVSADLRASLLRETCRVRAKSVETFESTVANGQPALAVTIDGMRFQLQIDAAGQAQLADATGSKPAHEKFASTPSIPAGFVQLAGYLVGDVRGEQKGEGGISILALMAEAQ